MITITVSNFRGCARAQLECAPIALLAGLNAAGKSSIAQGTAAALSGNTLPVPGLRSNAAGALVRTGSASGYVEVATANARVGVEWPSARAVSEGAPPLFASEYATGLQSIVTMAPKDRLRVLAEYLKADPTRDDLAASIGATGLDADSVTATIWPLIEGQGWDGAAAVRRERGAELKGQWRQATGANWGSRVGATWRPDLAELDEGELVAAVGNAQAARDRAISAEAVSDAERRRLEEEAELYGPREAAHERAEARVSEYQLASQKAQEARAALPTADRQEGFPCPHCSGRIIAVKVNLATYAYEKAPAANIDDAELRKRRMAIAEADGKLAHAYDDLQSARRDLAAAEKAVRDSLGARERIANWPRAIETGTDLATAAAQLGRAGKRLGDYRTKLQADELHARIEGNDLVLGILASDGLRAAKLARVLSVFNQELAGLSADARCSSVHVDDGGNTFYGGRPYGLLSSSEQYRVRSILAAAMAKLDGSAMLIFDGADILDAPSRAGLFSLIEAVDLPALVCVTLPRREQVPDLDAAGIGRSYWLTAGVVEPLGEKVAA